jgi:hypothetical protein
VGAGIHKRMGEVVQQMRKGEQAVGGVETISAASVAELEAIVRAVATAGAAGSPATEAHSVRWHSRGAESTPGHRAWGYAHEGPNPISLP